MIISTKKLAAAICFFALPLSGCTYTHYTIYSEPRGAQVYVDGELKGMTPYTLYLKDPVNKVVVVKKEGYQDYTKRLQSQLIPPLYNFYLTPGESSLEKEKTPPPDREFLYRSSGPEEAASGTEKKGAAKTQIKIP